MGEVTPHNLFFLCCFSLRAVLLPLRAVGATPMAHRSGASSEDYFESEDGFSSGPDAAAAGSGGSSMPLFRPSHLRCVKQLSGHHSGIRAIAWKGNCVYTGSYDNTIKCWNLDGGSCESTLEGHNAWVRSLFCHRNEPLLFSGSDDGEIKIWRTDTDELQSNMQASSGGILAITFDYDRSWLIAGCYDSSIHVWQWPSCELLNILPGHRSAVKSLAIYNGCLLSGRWEHTPSSPS
jgi:WD40 repeat protein